MVGYLCLYYLTPQKKFNQKLTHLKQKNSIQFQNYWNGNRQSNFKTIDIYVVTMVTEWLLLTSCDCKLTNHYMCDLTEKPTLHILFFTTFSKYGLNLAQMSNGKVTPGTVTASSFGQSSTSSVMVQTETTGGQ